MAFSGSVQKSQIPINCQFCETQKSIKWKCLDCSLLICDNCKDKIHLKIKNAKDHKIISIKDIGLHPEELDFTNIKCQQHAGQSCCLFCTTCDHLVCPTCFAKVHKKHDLIEINEAYDIKQDDLKKKQTKTQKNKAEIEARMDKLCQLQAVEGFKYEKVRQDIQSQEKALKQAVEKYAEKLQKELEQNHKSAFQSIKGDIIDISEFITQSDVQYDEVKDFMNTTDVAKFFKEVSEMKKSSDITIEKTTSTYCSIPKFIPGEITQSNFGIFQNDDSSSGELTVDLNINREFQTNLSLVSHLSLCHDDSLWIACTQDEVLQKVKPEGANLKTISTFNIMVFGMAITGSNDVLVITERGSRLKKIDSSTGELTDSVYDATPYTPTAVCMTYDNKVIIGGFHDNLDTTAVMVMSEKGDQEAVYEHDQHNQPIFRYARNITSTRDGSIHVADYKLIDGKGRIVVLGQDGEVINTYTGHNKINKAKEFRPDYIVTTPRDNAIVNDMETNTLHILNNSGILLTCYNTSDIGIMYPMSLAYTPTGQLYIGCSRSAGSTAKEAKLYEVNIHGC
ncbi:uncharacterized protein LOC143073023 [Mytilus galloprovincialis]|uniref:uncharacterized protein LOC143073023 n=1 Tax=Mytilus galloprovincialis TaxID=29158 RepID=UPI003F7BD78F